MALLQFRCTACGNKFEELTRSDLPAPACPRCGGKSERDYTGKVYGAASAPAHCTHHCATCSGCKR